MGLASLFLIPTAAFYGSLYRKLFGLESSAKECFARTLMAPTDWLQLWRLNCRLASMTSLATKSRDFEMEDKWKFIQTCLAKKIPVTPVFDMPKTLIAKDVLEEGGMGIHVLKNVLHGGRWILQVKTLATVWRAGRKGASTDHSCVMVDVPKGKTSDELGSASTSAHWYARGFKSFGMPVSTEDGSIRAHPDTGLVYPGRVLPGASKAAKLCEEAHQTLMPGVPLAGWDVAFCPPRDGSKEPELVLLEANLSCNFFRGSVAWDDYASLLDEHFAALDKRLQEKKTQ